MCILFVFGGWGVGLYLYLYLVWFLSSYLCLKLWKKKYLHVFVFDGTYLTPALLLGTISTKYAKWVNPKMVQHAIILQYIESILYQPFLSTKCIWKYHLQNNCHFVSAPIFNMRWQQPENACKPQIWPVSSLSQSGVKMRKTDRLWQKSYQFWRWSGYISMPSLRSFLLCVLKKMPGNLKFDQFHNV